MINSAAETRYPARHRPSELGAVCDGLLFKIFAQATNENERGFVVAFTSAHAGAGVTEVTRTLAKALGQGGHQLAVVLSYGCLVRDELGASGWDIGTAGDERNDWHKIQAVLSSGIERMRRQYRYVLIDCAPVSGTYDALKLAPLVDGIVFVVEANRTRKHQILYAERSIEGANGRILGHVLNKRTYSVPDLFHRIITAVGI